MDERALRDARELRRGWAAALQPKLGAAANTLDKGQPDKAIKKLSDFIAKVQRLGRWERSPLSQTAQHRPGRLPVLGGDPSPSPRERGHDL